MLNELPNNLVSYKRTPEFTETSIPQGLLHRHSTKTEVWAKIVVLSGELTYRILEPTIQEILLTPTQVGIIEPTICHEVEPHAGVRFYVEFYRSPLPAGGG